MKINKDYLEERIEYLRETASDIKARITEGGLYFFRPLPKQKEFFQSAQKHKIRLYIGGNRSGKTTIGAVDIVAATIDKHPFWKLSTPDRDRVIWCVSTDYSTARRTTIQKIFEMVPRSMIDRWYKQEYILRLTNGAEIQFKSSELGREHFQGAAIDAVWLDEEPPADVWRECMARTIDRSGKVLLTMTPLKGMTWVYDDLWIPSYRNGGSDQRIYVVQSDVHENRHLPAEEVENWASSMSAEEHMMRIEGKFICLTGRIWADELEKSRAVLPHVPTIDPNWIRCRAIDTGARNPTACAWMAIDYSGTIIVYDYYEEAGRTTEDHAQEIIRRSGGSIESWSGITVIDPTSAQWKYDLASYGVYAEDADNDVFSGIMRVKGMLHSEKLKISPTCKRLIESMKSYQWDPSSKRRDRDAAEKPKKKGDHGCDCIRYACARLRGMVSNRNEEKKEGTLEWIESLLQSRKNIGPYGSLRQKASERIRYATR